MHPPSFTSFLATGGGHTQSRRESSRDAREDGVHRAGQRPPAAHLEESRLRLQGVFRHRYALTLTLTLALALALALALLTVAQVAVPLILLRHHELVRVETLEEEVEAREPRHLARAHAV